MHLRLLACLLYNLAQHASQYAQWKFMHCLVAVYIAVSIISGRMYEILPSVGPLRLLLLFSLCSIASFVLYFLSLNMVVFDSSS